MEYPRGIREKVIARALAGGVTQSALAEEFGVSRSSIQNWLRSYRRSGEQSVLRGEKSPQSWSRAQRLEALLETHGLSEEETGAWCRSHGVHSHHLQRWRQEFTEGASSGANGSAEARALRQENKALKKELRRKERALAETTALLVLKKKAVSLWGEAEDE